MTKRLVLSTAILWAAAVGAAGCSSGEASDQDGTALARRGTLVVWVGARGKVTAESNVVITPPRWWGLKIARLVAKEGDRVEKGDVLMALETENLDERVRDVTRDIRSSEGSLESARANLRSETDRLQAAVNRAGEDLAKAGQALGDLKGRPLPTDLRNAEIDRETKAKAAAQGKVRYETMKPLYEAGGASLKQLEEKEMAYRSAEAEARRADLVWQVVRDGPTQAALRDAQITVEQCELQLAKAERTRDLTLAQLEESVKKAEAWLNMNRQTLVRIQRVQEACTVRAPIAGMVYYREIWTGEGQEKIKEGIEVRPWDRLMELPDSTRMQIRVEVEEPDVGKVVVDQTARIALDAYRGKPFTGRVTAIERVTQRKGGREMGRGDFNREDLGTKIVNVVVSFDGQDPLVRNGLNGRAEIRTGEEAKGILVPLAAVFTVEGKDVVYLMKGGGLAATPVTVGGRSDTDALVLSGVAEGDRVSLSAPGRKAEGEGASK